MTTHREWAEEAARQLFESAAKQRIPTLSVIDVINALLKAKAEGVRFNADCLALGFEGSPITQAAFGPLIRNFRDLAHKIERGEA